MGMASTVVRKPPRTWSRYLHEPKAKWFNKLSMTDIASIHLARAFVMNPEVAGSARACSYYSVRRCRYSSYSSVAYS